MEPVNFLSPFLKANLRRAYPAAFAICAVLFFYCLRMQLNGLEQAMAENKTIEVNAVLKQGYAEQKVFALLRMQAEK